MTLNLNSKISDNFTLREVLSSINPKCLEMNLKHVKQENIDKAKKIAFEVLEPLRKEVNEKFGKRNGGDIGIGATSWFRCVEWELLQKRSGKGEHPTGSAVDVLPIKVKDDILYQEIFLFIAYKLSGRKGGFAIKYPEWKGGKLDKKGFVHTDNGATRRWMY
jgi:hypothetical protein